jgi:hypothetical protein
LEAKVLDRSYLRPYAGKWVAIVNEQVVASGDSLDELVAELGRQSGGGEPELFKVPTDEEKFLVV